MVKIEEQRLSAFTELVRAIESKEEHLSFSSFKEFCRSPRHFIGYKLQEKVTTAAMSFGSAVHCLILEPDEFEKRYTVKDKPDLRYKENKSAWAAVLEYADANGLEIITKDDYDTARRMADFAYQDEAISWVLNEITHTEVDLSWKYGGYDWRGRADGVGESIYMDLKIINPLEPDRLRWRIRGDKLIWQPTLYQMAKKCHGKDFYMVCLENAPNGMVIRFDAKTLQAHVQEIDYYINQFNKCVFQDAWNEGYSFWAGKDKIYDWTDL